MSFILSVLYAELPVFCVSFMQSDMLMVSVKPFMVSVIVLNVVMLNVMAT